MQHNFCLTCNFGYLAAVYMRNTSVLISVIGYCVAVAAVAAVPTLVVTGNNQLPLPVAALVNV